MKEIEFEVDICMGCSDGGTVNVYVPVSDSEIELIKKCKEDFEDLEDYPGLEDLCERVSKYAIAEGCPDDEEADGVIIRYANLEDD